MNRKIFIKKIYPAIMLLAFMLVLFIGSTKSFSDNSNIPNIIKIAQLSDVHLDTKGKDKNSRMYGSSTALLKDAVSQINDDKKINAVVFSGDTINRPSEKDFYKFIIIAKTLKVNWYAIHGNHDVVAVRGGFTKDRFFEVLKKYVSDVCTDKTYYSVVPKKGYLFVFLDGTITNKITANGYFPEEELAWLDEELQNNADKKVVIVQHFPVVEPMHSNSHQVLNTQEYFNVIDKHNNVVAVLSGHYHKSSITKRKNVVHISCPSLVQYPNAYRIVKITTINDTVKVESEVVETRLKNIQKKSLEKMKKRSSFYKLNESDKKISFVVEK